MDGWVIIGTKLDNTKLEKDLKEAEKDLIKFQKEKERLQKDKENVSQKMNSKEFQDEEVAYSQLQQKVIEYKNTLKELESEKSKMLKANPSLAVTPDTPEYSKIKSQIQEIEVELSKAKSDIAKQTPHIEKSRQKYEEMENTLKGINSQLKENESHQETIKNKIKSINSKMNTSQTGYTDIEKANGKISAKTSEIIGKVTRWVLAIFSVRSAIGALSKASSTLAQYNKQYASDLQYIQYVMAQMLAPILQYIVQLAYKLLNCINYIANVWFGVNLFANASVKSFEAASNSLSSASKNAKELNKSTASFDTANILSDSSSSDSSSSTVVAPSVDLSNIQDVEVPEWLKKFTEFCKPIIDFFEKIIEKYGPVAGGIMIVVGAIAGFMILKGIIGLITGFGKAAGGVSADFTGFLDGLGKAATAIAVLGGIALVLNEVSDLMKTFSETGITLGEVAGLLGIVLGELALAFTAIALASKLMDWQGIVGAGVILAGFALVIHEVTDLLDCFVQNGLSLNDVIGLMATILISIVALMGSIALLGPLMTAGLGPFLVVVAGISAILTVMALTLPKILDACSEFIDKSAPGISQILSVIGEQVQGIIKQLGEILPPIINSTGNLFSKIFSGISNVINTVGNVIVRILESTQNLISNTLSSLLSFINRLGPAIESFTNSAINSATRLINFLISGIEYLVNTLIVGGVNKIITAVNSLSKYIGITIPTVSEQYIPRFTPRLKTGALINNPGKGVPVAGGRAIGGEAGTEGILPLTDGQAMEKLGQEIGKWIVINLQNIIKMDSRVMLRELKKVSNEKSFARNGV